jgi:hypothetical protein
MTQTITSAATSLNQIPGVFKLIGKTFRNPAGFWCRINDVLDYGGGKYDTFTEFLAEHSIRNWVFDPFNRSEDHNKLVRKMLTTRRADMAILANVLNVVKEPQIRREILEDVKRLTQPGAPVFITCHEGNRTSRGRKTTKGWQCNRPTKNYLREVRQVFPRSFVSHGGKMIYAETPVEARKAVA